MDLGLGFNVDLSDPFGKHERSQQDVSRAQFHRDRAHQEAREDSTFQRRVADANAAGLHPLAVLGAQISSPVVSYSAPYNPGSDSSVSISPAKSIDAAQTKLLDKQADLIDEQIKDARLDRVGRALTPDKVPLPPPNFGEKIVPPQRTSGYKTPWGSYLRRAPWTSDAQTYEDAIGEVGGSILGLGNLPADIMYTIYKDLETMVNTGGR